MSGQNVRRLTATFAGGEMSPLMLSRFDDGRQQQGVRKCLNMVTWPQGSARRRPCFQHVREAGDGSTAVRVIPFSYGAGQELAVEIGAGYFRFHAEGGTLLYIAARKVASVDTGTAESITFASPHGLASNDAVRMFADTGGTIPAGLTGGTTYYAIPVDPYSIQVSASSGPGAAVNLTSAGSGDLYVYKVSECPTLYVSSKNLNLVTSTVSSVNTGTDEMTTSAAHGLTTGDAILFTTAVGGATADLVYYASVVSTTVFKVCTSYAAAIAGVPFLNLSTPATGTVIHCNLLNTTTAHGLGTADQVNITVGGGTIIPGLATGTTYYARSVTANNFKLYTTAAASTAATPDTEVKVSGTGTGTSRIHKHYLPGDTVTNLSIPQGFYTCRQADPQDVTPGSDPDYWQRLPFDGAVEIENDYAAGDLMDLHYAQSGDVLTIVHQDYPPSELSRLTTINWSFLPISFQTDLEAPTNASMAPTAGSTHAVALVDSAPVPSVIVTTNLSGLSENDPIYLSGTVGDYAEGFYAIRTAGVGGAKNLTLKTMDGGSDVDSAGTTVSGGKIRYALPSSDVANFYRVTAMDASGAETGGSNATGGINNLFTSGSYNTITWDAVAGAARYRIYKAKSGIYGYIGETEGTSFKDDNIGPDLAITLPRFDNTFNLASGYPTAVGYFEGRRFFGGLNGSLRKLMASRVGYPSDFSYHIPVQDDDRISREIDARDALTVRHIVPMTQLVMLSDSTEFRVSPLNTDSITPDSISIRPQTFIGGSMVQPIVINGTLVFAANRGGHLREMGYRADEGFLTGDLSIRASHLFDGKSIVDMAYQKAPVPIVWAVSSDGKLLGMTYTPEEGVGGWHQHTTPNGLFESVCVVNDGGVEDSVYAVVRRTIDGTDYRMIERMTNLIQSDTASDWRFLDCGLTFDGTVNSSITVTRAATWAAGQSVTIAGTNIFRIGTADVGDYVRVAYNGTYYRLNVTAVASNSSATATILDAIPIATATTNFVSSLWGWMRGTIVVPSWLEGERLEVFADGAEVADEVVASNTITLGAPALVVHIGYGYSSELQLLPFAAQFEAYAQGRAINIKEATVRYWKSGEFEVGPELHEYDMSRIAASVTDEEGIERELQMPLIANSATLWVRQTHPLPLTVVSITTEATLGS